MHDLNREVRVGSGHKQVLGRVALRAPRAGLYLSWLGALFMAVGCVGGQSGSEGCVEPESPEPFDTFRTQIAPDDDAGIEDGGVPDDAGAEITAAFVDEREQAPTMCVAQ